MRKAIATMIAGMFVSSSAMAAVVTFDVRATSSTTVAPGGTVNYELTATVDTGDNDGLTVFVTSIVTDFGVAQPQITDFGIEIQDGWALAQLGTSVNDDLLDIGKGQINFNNYFTGIGQPGPVVLAFGQLNAPDAVGTYSVKAGDDHGENSQSVANVSTIGGGGSFGASVLFGNGFTVTVEAPDDGGDTGGGDTGGGDTGGGDTGGGDTGGGDTGGGDTGGGDTGGGDNTGGSTNNNNDNNNNRGPCGIGIPGAAGASFLTLCIARIGRRRDRLAA